MGVRALSNTFELAFLGNVKFIIFDFSIGIKQIIHRAAIRQIVRGGSFLWWQFRLIHGSNLTRNQVMTPRVRLRSKADSYGPEHSKIL